MNILAVKVKSILLWINDSICSLNKTHTRILILQQVLKWHVNILKHKTAVPDEFFPSIFPGKAIQVQKL